jgi:hypothetical protein
MLPVCLCLSTGFRAECRCFYGEIHRESERREIAVWHFVNKNVRDNVGIPLVLSATAPLGGLAYGGILSWTEKRRERPRLDAMGVLGWSRDRQLAVGQNGRQVLLNQAVFHLHTNWAVRS